MPMTRRMTDGARTDGGQELVRGQAGEFTIVENPDTLPARLRHAVVAIGNFDGAHRGHAAVIARAIARARQMRRPCAVVTFEPHPTDYFKGPGSVFRLTPMQAKGVALERHDVDAMIVVAFDEQLANQSPEAFVADVLVKRLQIAAVVVGYDFCFGKARAGTPDYLRDAGRRHGFAVEIVEPFLADVEGRSEALHSTTARQRLEAGDVAAAARLLGHWWFVLGEVVHGERRGRELGFPTANLRLDPSCRLRHGIYAVRLCVEERWHDAVASFGRRPTFDNGAPLLEVFVFDFAGDLYGKSVEVAFVGWIRGEEKFDGIEALIEQMQHDVTTAKTILAQASGPTDAPAAG